MYFLLKSVIFQPAVLVYQRVDGHRPQEKLQKGPQTESISYGLPTNATCQRRVATKIGSVWSGFLKYATIPQTRNNQP